MKKTVLGGIVLAIASFSVATTSCTDGYGTGFGQGDGTGKISLTTDLDPSVVTKIASRAEYNTVGVSDLSVQVTSADGSVMGPWTLAEFAEEERRFNIGTYTVEAFYGNAGEEGFEKPYFYGRADQVKVEDNKTTSVSLVATVGNAAVVVRYTDAFKNYMSSWSASVKNFVVERAETRPVYVMPGEVGVDVTFEKPNGSSATMEVKRFTAEKAHLYTLTVDFAGGSGNVESIVVSIDDSVDEEDALIDISDDVICAPAPEVEIKGTDESGELVFVPGISSYAAFNIVARGGLRSVELTTQSPALIARGWPETVDLMNADATTVSTMEGMGLKALGIFRNPDKLAVVELGDVLRRIPFSDIDNRHIFSLKAVDKLGKTSETAVLAAEAKKVEIYLEDPHIYENSGVLTVNLHYNAGNPAGVVELRKLTANGGSGVLLNITNCEKISEDLYSLRCTGQALVTEDSFSIYAVNSSITDIASTPIEVTPLPLLSPDSSKPVNAFASRAYVPVKYGKTNQGIAGAASSAKVMIATAVKAGSFVQTEAKYDDSTTSLLLENLTPATSYIVKFINEDGVESATVSFTTEAMVQIENGNLDADATKASSGRNWENILFAGWGTANEMTTSQGSDYGYCRISGTIQTTDAHSGTAALIRSVGWGSGNTATGSKGSSGKCKYTDAGMLHLGANRTGSQHRGDTEFAQKNSTAHGSILTDDLDCGIAFASRPAALTFWYKYSPKNSADRGLAEVYVYDASGNVLASGALALAAASSYTRQTIPLSYATATKAARIYVKFMSTNSPEYLVRTDSNFSGPGFANLGRGTFMGSQLYIDDVELTY